MENDLIRRGDVKALVSDTWWNEIESTPAVNAVEVVRCRECEYWQKPFDAYPRGWCKSVFRWKDATGYCDGAKRREDGDGDD